MSSTTTFVDASVGALDSVAKLVLSTHPEFKCQTTKRLHPNGAMVTVSLLKNPSDDAIELELGYSESEGAPWLEGTLYFGQRTTATVSLACATGDGGAGEVGDIVHFLLPRLLRYLDCQ
jgi:hypothetical protein